MKDWLSTSFLIEANREGYFNLDIYKTEQFFTLLLRVEVPEFFEFADESKPF